MGLYPAEQRWLPAQTRILGGIDFPHSVRAHRRHNLVASHDSE